MPIFRLSDDLLFPPPELAEDSGLLAVGGDLSQPRLLLAYSMGIFPWYSQNDPILWWSPDPRMVLYPEEVKISRSLNQTLRKRTFTVTFDTAFREVISACASVHRNGKGDTWITDEMMSAYLRLHRSGYAHSVEAWLGDDLAGGLYGVSLGGAFFGESMFTTVSNASKAAFVSLVRQLDSWGFTLVDCQMTTPHLLSLGAREVSRAEFLDQLRSALTVPAKRGTWRLEGNRPG
ncbi:MAG: leucyl/phenylalanyl-tRNA--protein transferase [Nitrospiraceae bacterium]|nr:MAG: leucyl/phenylalanyl-tRNA--protein transferase [Nitrospiraceae bacterium]